jgi:WD40 repeat protein
VLSLGVASPGLGADKFVPDYEKQVFPLLKKYCLGCHNADDAEGGLVMESYAELLVGGRNGRPIVPGKSGESLLLLMIEGKKKPIMPPKDNPRPSSQEIALLKVWVDSGAKGPAGSTIAKPKIPEVPVIQPTVPPKTPVNAVAITAKGDLAAIAGYQTVALAEVKTATIRSVFANHTGLVTSVGFSADGTKLIAAAGQPGVFGEARLWNLADGASIRAIRGHQDSLYAAELSPDGKLLATAGYDKQIILWNATDGQKIRTMSAHNDAVYALAFRPDGKLLASASGDRTVKVWNTATGERLDTFSQPLKEQYTATFSPDGKHLAAGGADKRIRVWEISATGAEGTNPILYSRFAHDGSILKLVYSADGKSLVSAAEDRTVKIWEAATVKERLLLERQPDWSPALAITPDGHLILVGRHDGSLALYRVDSGSKRSDFVPKPPAPQLAALAPRGVQRGVGTRVKLTGKNLGSVKVVKSPETKLVGKLLADPKPTDAEIWVEVTPAADLTRGTYDLAVAGPGGSSGHVKLYVGDLPQVAESEPNNSPNQSTAVSLPANLWGTLAQSGDADFFAFNASKGQTLVFDVAAASIGSKLNAVLTLFDPAGKAIVTGNDFDGQPDPLLAYTIAADGRYTLKISDLQLGGSADHFYRLAVGGFPFVTGVYPLSVASNSDSQVEYLGYNLPGDRTASVKSGAGGEMAVPVDPNRFQFRSPPRLLVGSIGETIEKEPNDAPEQATAIVIPGTINGRIFGAKPDGTDRDLFRFQAKAGETWILETGAAQRGSPVDTKLEVLEAGGKPIERVWLQATRDSMVAFRGINSTQLELRCDNWEEMELNQYMYMQGEVGKLFRMPQGPDSGFLFYGRGGQRVTFFDTTATTHALEDPCYIVEPYPPGTRLVPTGLPVFVVYYANDDSGDRKLGRDSRLTFRAPVDGTYLVRVTDSRDRSGERHAYRLTVRKPKPDFSVAIEGAGPTLHAGVGRQITFTADRIDGFDGDITLKVSSLPSGIYISEPIVIQAGHLQASATIWAEPSAAAPATATAAKSIVTATATIDGKAVTKEFGSLGRIMVVDKPSIVVRFEPPEVVVPPGGEATAMLKVERNGFKGRIQLDVNNLPHGVIVDNIGLNGVLIPEGQTQRQIFIAARKWVPETSRPCFAIAREGGNPTSKPVMLHVRRPAQLAEAKPP